jgi:RecA/RadA recombinase
MELFLAHLLRSQKVFLQANRLLKLEYFEEPNESPYKLMWACAQWFYSEHKQLIPVEHLYTALLDRMKGSPRFSRPEMQQNVLNLAHRIFSIPAENLIPDAAFAQLTSFINMRGVAPRMSEAVEKGADGIREFISSIKRDSIPQVVTGAEAIAPFLSALRLGVLPRIPTGVQFVDILLNGGPRLGEVYGLLGESGGGKTTLSNQIGVSSAKRKQRVAVFTYEEPVSNEYLIPVYANAAGISRNALELSVDPSTHSFDADTKSKLDQAQAQVGKYLSFYDMSGITDKKGYGGVEEISSILLQAREAGNPFEAVIIDWFWVMMTRVFNRDRKSKIDDERKYSQDLCDQIKNMACEHKIWILVNQQLSPAAAAGKRRKSWRDSAEMRSFAWYLHGCLVLEPFSDDTKVTKLVLSKGRNMDTSFSMVKLNGEFATFVSMSKDVIMDPRSGKWIDPKKKNAVPDINNRMNVVDQKKALDVLNMMK